MTFAKQPPPDGWSRRPADADATDPSVDPNATDPDPQAIERTPFAAQPENPKLRSLLGGLVSKRAPPPVESPTTDGDLAARYSASARAPRAAVDTLPPAPGKVVLERTPVPPSGVTARVRDRSREAQTVPVQTVPVYRRRGFALLVSGAFLVVLVVVAVAVLRDGARKPEAAAVHTSSASAPEPSASTSTAELPPSPSTPPDPPPPIAPTPTPAAPPSTHPRVVRPASPAPKNDSPETSPVVAPPIQEKPF